MMRERNTPNSMVRSGILEIMPMGQELDVQQIKQLLAEKKGIIYGKDYSEGNLSNALHVLPEKGLLERVGRGIYKRVALEANKNKSKKREDGEWSASLCLAEQVLRMYADERKKIEESKIKLCHTLQQVDLSNATEEEFEALKTVIAFKNALSELLDRFE